MTNVSFRRAGNSAASHWKAGKIRTERSASFAKFFVTFYGKKAQLFKKSLFFTSPPPCAGKCLSPAAPQQHSEELSAATSH